LVSENSFSEGGTIGRGEAFCGAVSHVPSIRILPTSDGRTRGKPGAKALEKWALSTARQCMWMTLWQGVIASQRPFLEF
jgi:hypothetical protein